MNFRKGAVLRKFNFFFVLCTFVWLCVGVVMWVVGWTASRDILCRQYFYGFKFFFSKEIEDICTKKFETINQLLKIVQFFSTFLVVLIFPFNFRSKNDQKTIFLNKKPGLN